MIVPLTMPIYDYKCDNGHRFEAMQSMSEDPITECDVCGAPARRVLHAPAVHFKGSGFYTTDYARKGAAKSNGADAAKPESKEGKDAKRSESKSESSSGSSSTSNDKGDKAASKQD